MPLASPPKREDPGFDDWLFRFYKQSNASSSATSAAFPGQNRQSTNGNSALSSGYSAYVPDTFEISLGNTLEIGSGSTLEIG